MNKLDKEDKEILKEKVIKHLGFISLLLIWGGVINLIMLLGAPNVFMGSFIVCVLLVVTPLLNLLHLYLYAKVIQYTRFVEFLRYPFTRYWYVRSLKKCSLNRLKYNRTAFGIMLDEPRPGHEWVIEGLRNATDKIINKRITKAKRTARKNYEKDIKKRMAGRI